MSTTSDNAICIRRWDFSETSQTVLLFGREIGLFRGLAKGAKRPKSRFSGGFDVLTRGQVVAIIKPGKDLATLTEWHLEQVYRAGRTDLNINRIALYMIDLVQHMFTDHDPHPAAFDLLSSSLDAFESAQQPQPVLLRFQIALLDECGYRPELVHDAQTGRIIDDTSTTLAFSSRHGGVVADTVEPDRWRVRRATVELLRAAQRDALPAEPNIATALRANRLLAAHYRELLGKQTATMTALFSDLRV